MERKKTTLLYCKVEGWESSCINRSSSSVTLQKLYVTVDKGNISVKIFITQPSYGAWGTQLDRSPNWNVSLCVCLTRNNSLILKFLYWLSFTERVKADYNLVEENSISQDNGIWKLALTALFLLRITEDVLLKCTLSFPDLPILFISCDLHFEGLE